MLLLNLLFKYYLQLQLGALQLADEHESYVSRTSMAGAEDLFCICVYVRGTQFKKQTVARPRQQLLHITVLHRGINNAKLYFCSSPSS